MATGTQIVYLKGECEFFPSSFVFGFYTAGCDRNTDGWPTRKKKEPSSGSANVTVTMGTDMLAAK